jgi:hypothetical protein
MGVNKTAHQLFVEFKKAYDSVRRELLYNILIKSMLGGPLVTTAWRVLRLRMEETPSRYGG